VKTIPSDGVTTFVLDRTSQTWRAVPEVDRPLWQHWLVIVKPDRVSGTSPVLHRNAAFTPLKQGDLR
jgi:hypothetical protein